MSWLFCLLMLRGWVSEVKRRFQVCLLWIVVGGWGLCCFDSAVLCGVGGLVGW